jgi:ribonuclease BN (tRNA processing enzyme)
VVYATDVESPNGFGQPILDFIEDADILIHDSQYLDRDYFSSYNPKENYGHSTVSMAVRNALRGRVKRLYLFHYDYNYTDRTLSTMLKKARKEFKNTSLAREGRKISLRS